MKRMLLLLCLSGCMLTKFRQQCTEYAKMQTTQARNAVVSAAEITVEIATEVATAAAEERLPVLIPQIEKLAGELVKAHAANEETGKTLAVVQEDIGRPDVPPPLDPQQAEALRMQYRAAAKMWKMAMAWVKSQVPMLGKLPGSPPSAPGGRWTPMEIVAAITAITAAVGGGAEATRRAVKNGRIAAENEKTAKAITSVYIDEVERRLATASTAEEKAAIMRELKTLQEKAHVRGPVQAVLKENGNGV